MGNTKKLAVAVMLFTFGRAYADIVDTSSAVRPDNSLIVDIQVRSLRQCDACFCHLSGRGSRLAGFPSYTGLPRWSDHRHHRKAQGKHGVHL